MFVLFSSVFHLLSYPIELKILKTAHVIYHQGTCVETTCLNLSCCSRRRFLGNRDGVTPVCCCLAAVARVTNDVSLVVAQVAGLVNNYLQIISIFSCVLLLLMN